MTDVGIGISMSGSGKLVVNNGAITFKGEHGVKVGSGVTSATLTNVTITGTGGQGKGVIKDGTGEMKMTDVDVSEVGTGVEVTSGNLTVSGGTMTDVGMGIRMLGSGRLTVNNNARITVKNGVGNYGIGVGGTVNATITGVEIKGTNGGTGKGVWMESSGKMTINGGSMTGVAMGVEATNGTLEIKGGTTIVFNNGNGNYGVKVGSGVTANLTNVVIRGEGSGKGVLMNGKTLGMTNVQISDVAMGVEAKKGGTLTIKEGSIGFKKDYGIGVWGTATANITGTTIRGEGSGKGVYATGVGKLTLTMTGVNISNVAM
ncbi:right-handed parallel beta-helix repeat-containing protein, partial [Bartonella bovis]|uniref:right-handed parallel beta-helix repeat-containing protein n=1 Tax=Bartonella bovis TaxID=155194 RepID=UPI00313E6027